MNALAPISQQVTFLHTADLDATARFYEQVFGLRLALDQGDCRIYHVTGGAFLGFCRRPPTAGTEAGVILTLVTADVDGWYGHLLEQGVVFEKPPTINQKYGIYHCFLRDPNGYLVEIQRFEDPRWGDNEPSV